LVDGSGSLKNNGTYPINLLTYPGLYRYLGFIHHKWW